MILTQNDWKFCENTYEKHYVHCDPWKRVKMIGNSRTTVGPKTFFPFHLRGSPRELINAGVKKLNWKKCNHSFTSGGSGINYTGMEKAELKKDARFFHSRWRGLGFINCGGERKNRGPTRPRFMSEFGTAQNRWKTISNTVFWTMRFPYTKCL